MAGTEYAGYTADSYGYGQIAGDYGGAGYAGTMGGTTARGSAATAAPPAVYGYGYAAAAGVYDQMPSPLDAEIQVVCREIQAELHALEQSGEYGEQFKNARRLLTTEANKLENNIDPEWLEVDINKPIKVTKKVLIPSFRHPKFNFVGKVLGPKGATLQNIAKNFKCHVYILGRGSTRDRAKEQELLQSGDPQFAHYGGPLHVKVETTAAPAVAYQRVAGVLDVLSQLLVPIKDTVIEGITTGAPEGGEKEEVKEEGGNVEEAKEDENGSKNGEKTESGYSGNFTTSTGSGNNTFGNNGPAGTRGRGNVANRGASRGNNMGASGSGFRGTTNNRGNRGASGGPMRGTRGQTRGYQPY